MRVQRFVALGVVSVAALGGGVAWAAAQDGSALPAATVTAPATNAVAPPPVDQVKSVAPEQTASFAILKHAPADGTTVSPGAAQFGANGDLARTATAANGDNVSVIPANGAICLGHRDTSTCNTTDQAVHGFLVEAEFCSPTLPRGHSRVVGLVPDGVGTVAVTTSAGPIDVEVRDNVYVADTASEPLAVSWASQTVPLGNPDGQATCGP